MTIIELLSSIIVTIIPLGGQLGTTEDYCGGETGGIYEDNKIYVCESGEDTKFYLNHEYGHPIYEQLTAEQKERYLKAYQEDKKYGIKRFYRDYEMSDVEEDFATNYSLMIIKEKTNIYIKKRQRIIKQILAI